MPGTANSLPCTSSSRATTPSSSSIARVAVLVISHPFVSRPVRMRSTRSSFESLLRGIF